MRFMKNTNFIDLSIFEEIDIHQLIDKIDNSINFKMYELDDSEYDSTIIIKIMKKES